MQAVKVLLKVYMYCAQSVCTSDVIQATRNEVVTTISTRKYKFTFQTGAMYLSTAIWDLRPLQTPTDTLVYYKIIGYMAPITYLFNSLIDIHLENRKEEKESRE